MVTTSEDEFKLFHCPALVAIKVVSGKWKTRILWLLRTRSYSFNELRRSLHGVTAKVLTEQISQLEDAGVIEKKLIEKGGQTYSDYGFSPYGREIIPVLDVLGEWGLKHRQTVDRR